MPTLPSLHCGRSRRLRRLLMLGAAAAVLLSAIYAIPSGAATPGSDSIGPGDLTATWTGPAQAAVTQDSDSCDVAGGFCDHFNLTVNVAPSYWDTHSGGANISISWAGLPSSDDFDLYVYQGGNEVKHSAHGAPGTGESVYVPSASGLYEVRAVYFTTSGAEGYAGTAEFKSKNGAGGTFFDDKVVQYGAASVVSPTFLGSEPQVMIERPMPYSQAGAVNPSRVFVDWPLSTRSQIGQLSRSTDFGKTFRLIYDPTCAERSRPTCLTGGGGDTETDVNLANGHVFWSDQEALANESLSSSIDHGDTFPADRQHSLSNANSATDRQWLAATDSTVQLAAPPGTTVEAFFEYHVPPSAFVQAVDQNGIILPQPAPQLTDVGQSGQIKMDNNAGSPGHGWLYVPYDSFLGGTAVATVHGPDYQLAPNWHITEVTTDDPTSFPWIAIDAAGNAYLSYDTGGRVYYSYSPISDRLNDPSQGGTPGTFWTPPVLISLPSVGSAVFPEIIAGDAGFIAVTYIGTTEFTGISDDAGDNVHWNTYAAIIRNATQDGGPALVSTGIVSHRFVHRGNICTSGTTCAADLKDRSFADMIDIGVFSNGDTGVVFQDNFSAFADTSDDPTTAGEDEGPFVMFARQVSGPNLNAAGAAASSTSSVRIPTSREGHREPPGDATWPNVRGADNLPALDLNSESFGRTLRGKVVGHLELVDTTIARRQADLAAYNQFVQSTPPADAVLYVQRFANATDVYFMALETKSDGTERCYGGRLDSNDRIVNPAGLATIAAGYHQDPDVHVTCSIVNSGVQFKAAISDFPGLSATDKLFSITGFSMVGPSGDLDVLANPFRTVDATPPFDTTS